VAVADRDAGDTMTEDNDNMGTNDDYDDMNEDEFDEEFAAGEPAELVFDHRVRVFGGPAARTDLGSTCATGTATSTRLTGPTQHTVSSVVLSSANG
jgi:hypothetical protein